MVRLRIFFALGALALSTSAQAFQLRLDSKALRANEAPAVNQFLRDIEEALPLSLKKAFKKPITIEFKTLGKHGFGAPACEGDTQKVNYRYGEEPRTMPWNRTHRVILNKGFLEEIARGPDASTKYNCGHGSLYRLAVATAIHEIAHHYDQLNLIRTDEELAAFRECEPLLDDPERLTTPEGFKCRAFFQTGSTVSGKPDFLALMHFLNTPEHRSNRSPDEYEFTTEQESYAVNLEYFALDPEFGCRRPSVYRFLSKHFRHSPPQSCEPNSKVLVSSYSLDKWRILDLDPARVYAIHYLMAEKGSDVSTGFGHSMLRIVTCSPSRKEVGPDCLKDVNDHVVVSYRANVRGLTLNYVAGLTGKYPSTLFLLKFMDVILEYTVGESRSVNSYPLILSRDQIAALTRQIQEEFWQYQNRYYFVTNNCATETLNLIRAALPETPVLFEDNNLTPKMVLNALQRSGMLDRSPIRGSDAAGRYRFPAIQETLVASVRNLMTFGLPEKLASRDPRDAAAKLMALSTDEREKIMEEMLTAKPGQRKAILGNFMTVEILFRTRAYETLEKKAAELALQIPESDLASKQVELLPWRLAVGGYGIPLGTEMPTAAKVRAKTADLKSTLDRVIEEMKPRLTAEVEAYTRSAALVHRIIAALRNVSQG